MKNSKSNILGTLRGACTQAGMRLSGAGRFAITAMLVLTLAVVACGCTTSATSYTVSVSNASISIGVTQSEYADIIDMAAEQLEDRGIAYELVEFDDVTSALDALASGEIEATFCTSLPYVTDYNNENGTSLTTKGALISSKMAVYSTTLKNGDDLPEGATIAVPADELGFSRAIHMFEDNKLLTLDEDADALRATAEDIVENPSNFNFVPVEESELAGSLSSYDGAAIPFSYAFDADLDFDSAVITETAKSSAAWEYADIVAIDDSDEAVDKFDKLVSSLREDYIGDAVAEKFGDAVTVLFDTTWGNM